MSIKIEINCNQEEEIITQSLKIQIGDMLKDNDPHETIDNKSADLSALLRVLRYYSTTDDYDAFLQEIKK